MLDIGYGHGIVLHMDRRPDFYRQGTASALATTVLHRSLIVRLTQPDGSRVCRTVARLLRTVAVVDQPNLVLVSRDNTWSMRSLVWMTPGDARRVTRWGQAIDNLPHKPVELTPAATLEVQR